MRFEEGPAFGALIIAMGVAFLINQQTGNTGLALLVGAAVAIADYILVIFIKDKVKK